MEPASPMKPAIWIATNKGRAIYDSFLGIDEACQLYSRLQVRPFAKATAGQMMLSSAQNFYNGISSRHPMHIQTPAASAHLNYIKDEA